MLMKMAKPKFDYNGNAFYDEILALAMQGLSDAEIADSLSDKLGNSLSPEAFSRMKNGKYDGWTKKQNEKRSERICQVLARGRRKINAIVRGAYLKAAIGGKKVKSETKITRRMKLPDGTLSDVEDVQTSATEQELPPNVQALSTWLFHHDEEWRKISKGENTDDIPKDIDKGIDIDAWIKEEIK